jgi:hypothetical protein
MVWHITKGALWRLLVTWMTSRRTFPCDFEYVWRWAGDEKRSDARRKVEKYLVKDEDYMMDSSGAIYMTIEACIRYINDAASRYLPTEIRSMYMEIMRCLMAIQDARNDGGVVYVINTQSGQYIARDHFPERERCLLNNIEDMAYNDLMAGVAYDKVREAVAKMMTAYYILFGKSHILVGVRPELEPDQTKID